MRSHPILASVAAGITMASLTVAAPASAAPAKTTSAVPAPVSETSGPAAARLSDKRTLRKEAPRDLKIGSAVWGTRDLAGYHRKRPTTYQRLLAAEFNSLTPENDMKWESIHPAPGVYDFSGADAVMNFARANKQSVRGHTLLWHSQNPTWVTDGAKTWTCRQARAVLKDHITTVVGRYRGRVYEWDVANEIFQDTWDKGGVILRTSTNPFFAACSDNPIGLLEDAFRWAHRADPKATLFLNDYNAEGINDKTNAYYALAKRLLADGVPLGGMGSQGHLSLAYGFDDSIQANFERFAALGLKVTVTEADVRIPLGASGQPTPEQARAHADRYDAMLQACINVKACSSFTVWQFADQYSWVPGVFAGEGWATIMTEKFAKKPAYYALRQTLHDATPGRSPRGRGNH